MNEPSHYGMPELTPEEGHETLRRVTRGNVVHPRNPVDTALDANRSASAETTLLREAYKLLWQARGSFDMDSDWRANVDRWTAKYLVENDRL